MMKMRATVISWQQSTALLQYETNRNHHHTCGGCKNHAGCPRGMARGQLEISIAQPLEPGQQIWLEITNGSLLFFALMVYLTPLLGLIFGGILFQWLFFNDYFTATGTLIGGAGGFFLARMMVTKLEKYVYCRTVVLKTKMLSTLISIKITD